MDKSQATQAALLQIRRSEGADAILGGGPGVEAVSEPRHIRRGQAGRASAVGPLLEGRQAPLVVAADPGLNGAVRASQGPGDRGGGVALLGQHDGLMTQPDPFLREGFGQSLKFFEAVMVLDKHRSSSWCDSDAQSILPNRHNPWNRSARIFRTWYDFPFVPFDDSTTIRWTPAVDPLTGETWHVPAALVYMPYYYYKDTPDAPIIQPISTGMACHCSLAEAAVSAVCEVVERDAFTITWQARLAHPQIPVESLSDSNYELVRRLEWTRASVSLFNITLDAGIPTVLAVLSSPSPRTPGADFCRRRFPESRDRRPVQPGGAGTYPAYMQHITNLLPRLTPSPPAHENVVDQVTHLNFWCDHGNAHLADFLGHRRSGLTSGRSRICQPATPWPT